MSNTTRHILSDDSRGIIGVLCTVSQKRQNLDEGIRARANDRSREESYPLILDIQFHPSGTNMWS